jgi:hypothetical protein
MQINGVDVTDPTRNFTADEWLGATWLVLRDRTLHSSELALDGAAVPAGVTIIMVILEGSVIRVQLTLPVTVIPLLPLTVNPTRLFRNVDLRMVVVSGAARTAVDSRMVLVANDR